MKQAKYLTIATSVLAAAMLVSWSAQASVHHHDTSGNPLPAGELETLHNAAAIDVVAFVAGVQDFNAEGAPPPSAADGTVCYTAVCWDAARTTADGQVAAADFRVGDPQVARPVSYELPLGLTSVGGNPVHGRSRARLLPPIPSSTLLVAASLLLCFVAGAVVKEKVQAAQHGGGDAHPIAKLILRHAPKFLQADQAIQAATTLGMPADQAAAELLVATSFPSPRTQQ